MPSERNDQFYEDEIDLKEIFSVLWKRKWFICGVVIISVVLAYGWCVVHSKSYTKALIQLNFSGIDKHLYPDGTGFEMNDIISQDILYVAADAIDNAEHRKLYLSNPRKFIFIEPEIPVELKEKIKEMQRNKQTYNYLPSQFWISFIQPRDGVFTHEEKKQVLLAINKAFDAKFAKEYVNQKLLAVNLTPEIVDRYDYIEVVDIFKSYLDSYIEAVNDMIKQAGFYRSSQSGDSFVDILTSLENIRTIDLDEIESILRITLETKKKDTLLKKHQYKVKVLEKEMMKKQEEAKIAKALLQDVWQHENLNNVSNEGAPGPSSPQILVDASVLDKLSGKDYKSVLLQKALDAEVAANSLRIEANDLKEEITTLMQLKNTHGQNDITAQSIAGMLEMTRSNIVSLGQKANKLSKEYWGTRYYDIIMVLENPFSGISYDKSPSLVVMLSFMISFILSIFLIFILEYIGTSNKKQQETEKTNHLEYRKKQTM